MMSQAATGATVAVQIRRLLPFGLLVSLEDGRAGIIRERELDWDRNARRHWREHVNPGDSLHAMLLGEGRDQQLELSLRLAQHDPWSDLPGRYQLGQSVDGIVTGIRPYGVFVEIEPGITGLLHRSRLPSWTNKEKVIDLFWPGDRVKAAIELIDPTHRRLRLNLGKAWLHRWQSPESPRHAEPGPRDPAAPAQAGGEIVRMPLELPLGQLAPLSFHRCATHAYTARSRMRRTSARMASMEPRSDSGRATGRSVRTSIPAAIRIIPTAAMTRTAANFGGSSGLGLSIISTIELAPPISAIHAAIAISMCSLR